MNVFSPEDLSADDRELVMERAAWFKATNTAPQPSQLRVGALYFNPSLRTRVSFEQAVALLGGQCQTLNTSLDTWGLELDPKAVMDGTAVENVVEAARVLGRYFHILGVRSFRREGPWHEQRQEPVLSSFAEYSGVPVVSLEGAVHHPCQGLADLLTLRQHFGKHLSGLPVALCWSWHPRALPAAVPHSFLSQAALAGCDIALAHPPGFELDPEIVTRARLAARSGGGDLHIHHQREPALRGRQLVYVKSWGPLEAANDTPAELRHWCLDQASLSDSPRAKVMHCLPVRRGVVIAGDVLDSERSIVSDQAENRLWAQAALIELLARRHGGLS
ncbi:MAG: acetylornithine carbamoyltransferase [Rickettsiales bacterium]|nr:acetylornithine carbamoyltransferase [Rickettsiales bacterium]|tara:strand:+ start:145 stop:1140 length:996 start_codon:yes stop_codon:yes gene_type:complete